MLRTDSVIAQFMYWATFCPVHEMGNAVAQFMKWAGLCPVHEMGRYIFAHFMNWALVKKDYLGLYFIILI